MLLRDKEEEVIEEEEDVEDILLVPFVVSFSLSLSRALLSLTPSGVEGLTPPSPPPPPLFPALLRRLFACMSSVSTAVLGSRTRRRLSETSGC